MSRKERGWCSYEIIVFTPINTRTYTLDPNETLKQIREHASAIIKMANAQISAPSQLSLEDKLDKLEEHAYGLAEFVEVLDAWLVRSGFLPSDWNRGDGSADKEKAIDKMAEDIKCIAREGREPYVHELMAIARVFGTLFPTLHSRNTHLAAFVNALPVPFDEKEENQ